MAVRSPLTDAEQTQFAGELGALLDRWHVRTARDRAVVAGLAIAQDSQERGLNGPQLLLLGYEIFA